MKYIITFLLVFTVTIFFIHLLIHLRQCFIENKNEIYIRINKLNNLIKYKSLRAIVNLGNSLQSDVVADDGTLGLLIFSMIKKYLKNIIKSLVVRYKSLTFVKQLRYI
jgi:hypothetical protein